MTVSIGYIAVMTVITEVLLPARKAAAKAALPTPARTPMVTAYKTPTGRFSSLKRRADRSMRPTGKPPKAKTN